MTTIAYDGRYIACDSQITYGSRITISNKSMRIGENFIVFVAGNVCSANKAINYLSVSLRTYEKGQRVVFPNGMLNDEDSDFSLWVVNTANGIVSEFGSYGMTKPELSHQDTIGSGGDFALAAMYLGKSAREAVQVASVFDCYTSGKIHVFDTKTGAFIEGGEHLTSQVWNAVPMEV